jgi:Flp pilus assembly protein TadB
MTIEPSPGHHREEEPPAALKSERVVLPAPLSFTGATQRLWRSLHGRAARSPAWQGKTAWWALLVLALIVAWAAVAVMYVAYAGFLIFLPLLVAWRLVFRSRRKRKLAALRHQEMLAAIERRQS